jgi:deazaflavin-dependent oxidoreductase (nitroreductase family)
MKGNGFVVFLLRSPMHRLMSGSTMLITVTGRKTGRAITTPVNYVQNGDTIWVLSSRERNWWRNLRAGAPVTLHLQGKDRSAVAQVILAEDEVAVQLGEYVRQMPVSARALGIRMEAGKPDAADLCKAAQQRLMIRIGLLKPA